MKKSSHHSHGRSKCLCHDNSALSWQKHWWRFDFDSFNEETTRMTQIQLDNSNSARAISVVLFLDSWEIQTTFE
jgi:hypothetical protein